MDHGRLDPWTDGLQLVNSCSDENLEKRKEKANLLEKIQTLESEIAKIKSENGSLRAKLRLVPVFYGRAMMMGVIR